MDGVDDDQRRWLQKTLKVFVGGSEVYREVAAVSSKNGTGGFSESGNRALALTLTGNIPVAKQYWDVQPAGATLSYPHPDGTVTVTVDLSGEYTYDQRWADLKFLVNWTDNVWAEFPEGTNHCRSYYKNDDGFGNLFGGQGGVVWFPKGDQTIRLIDSTLPPPVVPVPQDESHVKEFSAQTGGAPPWATYYVTNHISVLNIVRQRLFTSQRTYCKWVNSTNTILVPPSVVNDPNECSTGAVQNGRIDLPMADFPVLIWPNDFSEYAKQIFVRPGGSIYNPGPNCQCI